MRKRNTTYNAKKKLNKCCDVNLRQNRWKQYGKTTLTPEKKFCSRSSRHLIRLIINKHQYLCQRNTSNKSLIFMLKNNKMALFTSLITDPNVTF